ncbi:FAD-binding protein [Raoultibacter phocaeensis]|uniref:FAD-binding protein n=1 Tax=Raoultibacter phocaeensis TaxID=2479841 RepID=UPI001119C091|nr:FAD-binding protein [Raoultibacter phocaeensis]
MIMRKEQLNRGISRRNFLKGSTLAAAGLATVGLAGCASQETTGPNGNLPESWDAEADIVVVGLGAAGLSASIAAKMAGAEHVLALEVAPEEFSGGTTRVSGDMLMIPESVDAAVMYQTELNAGYEVPEDFMQAWAEGVCGNMEWLSDELGYDLQPATAAAPEFPGIPGGDKIKTYYVDGICGMSSLWIPLRETADELGVEVMYDTRATELIYNYETKEVYGIAAEGKHIKAKRGVILACGGFAANPEMMQNYSVSLGCPRSFVCGSPYNVGDGVKMAQQIGADLWHMNSYAAASTCVRAESPDSLICNIPYPMGLDYIYVNNEGKRFMYEELRGTLRHGKGKERGVWPLLAIPTPSYMILGNDAGSKDILGAVTYMAWSVIMETGKTTNEELIDAGIMVKADTIEELAEKIGYPPETLTETVNTYNQYCAEGADKDFGRGEAVYDDYYFNAADATTAYGEGEQSTDETTIIKEFPLVPLEPPFYAIEIALGMLNTQGGAKRNGLCQVLNLEGEPIPRLYSAGEFGTIYGYMYNGGGNISEAVASGRIAGQECAGLDTWDKQK